MRSIVTVVVCVLVVAGSTNAQLKSQVDQQTSAARSLVHPNASISSFFGLLNSDDFRMQHSFSVSYLAGSGYGLSLANYTNSMFYRIAGPLDARVDLTLMGSPFGSYGLGDNHFNKLYVSRAELNYRPSDNTVLRLGFSQMPFGYFNDPYYPSTFTRGE
jgi:hypothetical protein